MRFHLTVRRYVKSRGALDDCINATTYPDIQELMTVADVAIADYSSWIYYYVLIDKPGFLYATDLDECYTERGFYYPPNESPFPVCTDIGELQMVIEHFDEDAYREDIVTFLTDKGCMEDAHASERVADIIELIVGLSTGRLS